MAKRDRAAYMRDYRARQAAGFVEFGYDGPTDAARITELEQEVRRLEAELAKRPTSPVVGDRFNSRPFTPVPKRGK